MAESAIPVLTLRIFAAEPGIGMNLAEAKRFLSSTKPQIQLGTVDRDGDPNIHPTWYHFNATTLKIYIFTASDSRKARNLRTRKTVYFDVDVDDFPYKGVRGKAHARVLPDDDRGRIALVEKIVGRYIDTKSKAALDYIDGVRRGESIVIELTPAYFSTWDHFKLPQRDFRELDDAIPR